MITPSPVMYHTPPLLDPNSAPANNEPLDTSAVSRPKRGIADTRYLWPQNHTLTIAFMDMPKKAQDLIKLTIESYAPLVNLKFKFVKGTVGDIRISGHKDISGDWSAVGTAALKAKKDKPTMHINLVNKAPSNVIKNTLHEFGHALGLEHEHQHPQRSYSFNKDGVYKSFLQPGITKEDIDNNIIATPDPANSITSAYDQKSIMHYGLSASSTSNNVEIPNNFELSEGDKAFLKQLYPPAVPKVKPQLTPEQIQARRYWSKRL
ncbi:M12 family metallopeptidase [Pseudomonas sp. B22129]|uniref:M12 family metallopeptidase n=1 Tax=Pseudomonas sp. B22129 TaxID=3235111 RepID=UPI003783C288